jgi:hypothetical protein
MVLAQAQHHRIVDDPAIGRGEQHVLALADCALRQVAGREQLGEAEAVAAADLELALDRHVPQRHVVQKVPVLGFEVVEVDREEHVVVDGVAARSVRLLRLVERRLAESRTALDQAHVERHVRSDLLRHRWVGAPDATPAPPAGVLSARCVPLSWPAA